VRLAIAHDTASSKIVLIFPIVLIGLIQLYGAARRDACNNPPESCNSIGILHGASAPFKRRELRPPWHGTVFHCLQAGYTRKIRPKNERIAEDPIPGSDSAERVHGFFFSGPKNPTQREPAKSAQT
jgi:hypothetical protein